ncbi:MAG: glutamate racemase, partial [Bacteroidota bacterium]
IEELPHESLIYVADRQYCPYGSRPAEEVRCLSEGIARFLTELGCKMIVIACNTATTAAISHLRRAFDLPFVGMEPAIKPAVAATRSQVIGVLATQGTFAGGHFLRTKDRYAQGVKLIGQIGQGLVELVEAGQEDSEQAVSLLSKYLEPMLAKGADQIVLGCSHYPFLWKSMERVIQERATIIDPAPAVVRQISRLLIQHQLMADPGQQGTHRFIDSAEGNRLRNMVARIAPAYLWPAQAFKRVEISRPCLPA